MNVSRRTFLKYCALNAAALGLSMSDLGLLGRALANPAAPKVVWLQGCSCTGCSVSFLDFVSTTAPKTVTDVLIDVVNVVFHPTIMAPAGDSAVALAKQADNFILVAEGAVPMAFNGNCCITWTYKGIEYTHKQVIQDFANRAAKIVCVGACASFGGVSAAPPNPTGSVSVSVATGKPTINLPGCPVHPDWVVWGIVQLLLGNPVTLDTYSRPTALYGKRVHSICPRRETEEADFWGIDNECLKEIGCRGPLAYANCPTAKWNNKQNWCVDANVACINCTGPGFPYAPIIANGSVG